MTCYVSVSDASVYACKCKCWQVTCERIGLRIQGAPEHELAEHSECSDRLRKSKEKAEEIGENDGICSEMGNTAGQDRASLHVSLRVWGE